MQNLDVRWRAKSNGLYLWQIAEECGISEVTLSRWLRFDLSDEKKNKINTAIDELLRKEVTPHE